ncbi:MAG: MurR/RpiR family transcriptional regulator [Oceanospirillaceae bacterium]|nr:MurR/RpiR family transcriptional regulator [Oceanospirillaceae bacterium]
MPNPPKTLPELMAVVTEQYATLSKRLSQVAQYLLDNPDEIAFGTVAVISKDAGVHPSTLVRFANTFGYSGFSEMQGLFQQELLQDTPSYQERIRLSAQEMQEAGVASEPHLLNQFVSANTQALEHLAQSVPLADMERAIDILVNAKATYIAGVRRAYVVSTYFSYALQHIDRRAYLIDGVGGMYKEQASTMMAEDALIAISFYPYADETQNVVASAIDKKVPLILITDSALSPLASSAEVCFVVKEAEVHTFRSLSSSLCLAQSLSIGLAYRLEKQKKN